MKVRIPALILIAASCHLAAAANDLRGVVKDANGKPLAEASVHIYTAAVRTGASPLCPSCYTDCAKRALTDPEGRFLIPDLDPELIFRVLVVGEGYKPQIVPQVDPAKANLEVRLSPFNLAEADPKKLVRGRVVDENGKGIPQATLQAEWFKTSGHEGYAPGIFDPLAVTAPDGSFALAASQDIEYVHLKVAARGFAPNGSGKFATGQAEQVVVLKSGVSIRGRVVHERKPVPGVKVGLVQENRGGPIDYPFRRGESFYGPMEIGTNEEGEFIFTEVPAQTKFFIYGMMDRLKNRGAIPAALISTPQDGSTLQAGDLEVRPGHILEGRVVLSDGQPIPPKTRLMLARDDAWDHQIIELPADGRFKFEGIPSESYCLNVQIRGYSLSLLNKSVNRLFTSQLMGVIDSDIAGLNVLLEKVVPGAESTAHNEARNSGWDFGKVKNSRLEGAPE